MNDTIRAYIGVITERQGPEIGLPSEITYSARAVNTTDGVEVVAVAPHRRVSEGAKVIAAGPGDLCLLKVPGKPIELYVFEGVPFNPCPEIP